MAYRAFWAMPPDAMRTSTGQYTNAVHGFMNMLISLINKEKPTHIGVAFDTSKKTFRAVEYPEYKATREKTPEEFKGQVDLVKELLDALRIGHEAQDGFEADDIIATWATQADEAGWEVLVCSGDRDILQLSSKNVTVLYPKKGVSVLERMTPAAVAEKYGVSPQRYPELAALVGEQSDNLPGVPGVGPKTAAKWIAEYDGLENLIVRKAEVKGKAGESFRNHLDEVLRNRRLNALVRDLAGIKPIDQLGHSLGVRSEVDEICRVLELRSIRQKLEAFVDKEPAKPEEAKKDHLKIQSITVADGELGAWLAQQELVGISAMGAFHPGGGDLQSLALCGETTAVKFDVAFLTPADENALVAWLASDKPKAFWSAKPKILAAWDRGWRINNVVDVEIQAYLLHPDQRGYELSKLAWQFLGRDIDDEDNSSQPTLDFQDGAQLIAEAVTIKELADLLFSKLAELNQTGLFSDIEVPLQQILADMEYAGIAVDLDFLTNLHKEFEGEVAKAQAAAYEVLGREVNLSSPKQLQGVLFDEFKMPKTRKTNTGYTTNAEALEWLFAQTEHPFLAHLLRHRDQIKMLQIVEGLERSVLSDGRIHTTFLQTVAATGRLSSKDPNLQNIPARTPVGRRIREVFVAGKGYENLLTADYSQIEMRIMAHASQDEKLIEAFRSGADFHSVTASEVFGVPAAEVTAAQRSKIKAMNYGLAYGLGAFGLSQQLKVSRAEAKELMDNYFERFGDVQKYLNSLVEKARKDGYTETIFGRRRYLPDLTSSNRQRREMAERAALNAPIQGSSADIIKIAMLRVKKALADAELKSRILLQVHDELVLEVAPGEAQILTEILKREMSQAVELLVPLEVSVGIGPSWFAAAH